MVLGLTDRISVQGHEKKYLRRDEIRFKLIGSNFAFIDQFLKVLPEIFILTSKASMYRITEPIHGLVTRSVVPSRSVVKRSMIPWLIGNEQKLFEKVLRRSVNFSYRHHSYRHQFNLEWFVNFKIEIHIPDDEWRYMQYVVYDIIYVA